MATKQITGAPRVVGIVAAMMIFAALLMIALEPISDYLAKYWPAGAILAALILALWRIPLAQARAILQAVGGMFLKQPLRGLSIGAIILAAITAVVAAGFEFVMPWMQFQIGTGYRLAWVATSVLLLMTLPAVFVLFRATGFPADGTNVWAASRWLSVIVLGLFAFITYERPNQFFDPVTHEPLFMVKKSGEGPPYFYNPKKCPSAGCIASDTGEELVPGTAADVARFKKEGLWEDPWGDKLLKRFDFLFKESTRASLPQPAKKVQFGPPPGAITKMVEVVPWENSEFTPIPIGYCGTAVNIDDPDGNNVIGLIERGGRVHFWDGRWPQRGESIGFRAKYKPATMEIQMYPDRGSPCY